MVTSTLSVSGGPAAKADATCQLCQRCAAQSPYKRLVAAVTKPGALAADWGCQLCSIDYHQKCYNNIPEQDKESSSFILLKISLRCC